MIDRQALLTDLQDLLKALEADLLERSESAEVPEVGRQLRTEYERARSAERTAENYEDWRSDRITQAAAAWVLSCVFARFLEDNQLVDPPKLSGPGERLQHARDQHELYFTAHAKETDREYLLSVFAELGSLPGAAEVFGKHNPINEPPNWLSGDAAGGLLQFFQRIVPDAEDANTLVHDFTDPDWDTRFLGDLYQDLSEAARKKYALLQTPEFVEEFILDRTLEPALDEFGLDAPPVTNEDGEEIAPRGFRMIDPACGSGHFLLGAFHRILDRWRKKELGAKDRDLVQRTLDSIHGVDINPYAVAIARFRLLLAALKESGIGQFRNAPDFHFNLAAGDSLLHGVRGAQQVMAFHELAHHYQSEDLDLLRRILRPGTYQAVVANPPYITPKDSALNQAYRDRHPSCYRQYSLAVPFMERIFRLAVQGQANGHARLAGFTGQITANSFMKREFGKKVIEEFLPKVDLTHVIDTSGAYIPGHGTPTVILLGRHRRPVCGTVRTVMGIRGEPSTPENASRGQVWTAICQQIDTAGSESEFVSVADTERERFATHPWSIGGGGAAELKEQLEDDAVDTLSAVADSIGFCQDTHADEAFVHPLGFSARKGLKTAFRPQVRGDNVRDWTATSHEEILFPYDDNIEQWAEIPREPHWAWLHSLRSELWSRSTFDSGTYRSNGRPWFDFHQFPKDRLRTPLSIVFAFVATHNHFVLDRGCKVFNRSAPVIKLPADATEDDHLALLGLLNSSTACFWMKQIFHDKGSTVDSHGARQTTVAFENFREFTGTGLLRFPLPEDRSSELARKLDTLACQRKELAPSEAIRLCLLSSAAVPEPSSSNGADMSLRDAVAKAGANSDALLRQMIALQEELDWQCYHFYSLTEEELTYESDPPPMQLGQRAFEYVMARKMAAGEMETTWFDRHGSTPITEVPSHWPEDYKRLVKRRIEMIETDCNIGLIEQPEYKRRWNLEPWDAQLERTLRKWLLDRLESYFDLDGRMNDDGKPTAKVEVSLFSTAALADIARTDEQFLQVGELYRDDPAFDVQALVHELVAAESVPLLPVCRYRPSGLRKRVEWEKTWELQRQEDGLARRRQAAEEAIQNAEKQACAPIADDIALAEKLQNELREAEQAFRTDHFRNQKREYSLSLENEYLLNTRDQNEDGKRAALRLSEKRRHVEKVLGDVDQKKKRLITESPTVAAAHEALRAIPNDPEIPVPPKYTSEDFISTGGAKYWALRGKLDVPKERWVSFPHCDAQDGTPMIAWAGYDHLQLAKAISAWYVRVQEEFGGSDDPRLEPLLACLIELLPWLKQWHNEPDSAFEGLRMGDHFEGFINEEARKVGKTIDEIKAWQLPKQTRGRRKKSNRSK